MQKTRSRMNIVRWLGVLVLTSQLGCSLPADFWANKFGEIVNGAILGVVEPVIDSLITTPVNNALGVE